MSKKNQANNKQSYENCPKSSQNQNQAKNQNQNQPMNKKEENPSPSSDFQNNHF